MKRIHKSPGSPDDGNPIAEGKGVLSDQESEGSLRQSFDVTNRNRIQGLLFRATDLGIRTPYCHPGERRVNPAHQNERVATYPGRSLRRSGQPDSSRGDLRANTVKKSAEGIVGKGTSQKRKLEASQLPKA